MRKRVLDYSGFINESKLNEGKKRQIRDIASLAVENVVEWFKTSIDDWEELEDKEDKFQAVEADIEDFFNAYDFPHSDDRFINDNYNEIVSKIVDYLDE